MTKKIIAIWAEDSQHLIGSKNKLPWYLPKELQHFKETTMGGALLMGRVTFDGMNRRILPGRETVILTHDEAFQAEGVTHFNSREAVLQWFANQDKNLYIVGGATVYQTFKEDYQTIIKTTVHGEFDGDTYFPQMALSDFREVSKVFYPKDDKNPYDFTITVLEKSKE